jgi:TRAP-type mannitol/chloroaromatic compound transport system permease small subunit
MVPIRAAALSASCKFLISIARTCPIVENPGGARGLRARSGFDLDDAGSKTAGTISKDRRRRMKSLLAFSRVIDAMNERLSYVANWLVLLSCLISAGNAFSRYAFSISSNAWLEIQWYMFAAMVMLGTSYTLKKNEHVRVDIVYSNLSTRRQIKVDIFGGILFLMPAALIMAYLSWPIFHNSWAENEISSNAGGLVRWPVKIFLPLGFALLSLQGISELIKRVAMLTGRMEANLHYERPLQ